MPKWIYKGAIFPLGPYRGENPESVDDSIKPEIETAAKRAKIKPDEARKDFIAHLVTW